MNSFFFFEKGKRKLSDLGIPDILECDRVLHGYPTEKPVEISEILIKQSSNVNDIIIDPFMGSCSTGVAALKNDRIFWGNDISPVSIEHSEKRLLEIVKDTQIDKPNFNNERSYSSTGQFYLF